MKKESHWNHRVIEGEDGRGEKYVGIHEVYYDKKGKINGWTLEPKILADDIKGLEWTLKEMMKALKTPVLKEVKNKLVRK